MKLKFPVYPSDRQAVHTRKALGQRKGSIA